MRQWHFSCNLHSWAEFVRTIHLFAVALLAAVLIVCAFFSLSAHSGSEPVAKGFTQVDRAVRPTDPDPSDDAQGAVDLFGNDVTDAVARYQFDATGSLYEVHSPQTEIPKLGSPKS